MPAWLKILLLSSVTLGFLILDISTSSWTSALVTLGVFIAVLIWVVRREHKPTYSPIIKETKEDQQAASEPQNVGYSSCADEHPTGH